MIVHKDTKDVVLSTSSAQADTDDNDTSSDEEEIGAEPENLRSLSIEASQLINLHNLSLSLNLKNHTTQHKHTVHCTRGKLQVRSIYLIRCLDSQIVDPSCRRVQSEEQSIVQFCTLVLYFSTLLHTRKQMYVET